MSDARDRTQGARERALARHVRCIREGHGANCSSIGSVIDTLFATAVVGGAVLAALSAMMGPDTPAEHGDAAEADEEPSDSREGT